MDRNSILKEALKRHRPTSGLGRKPCLLFGERGKRFDHLLCAVVFAFVSSPAFAAAPELVAISNQSVDEGGTLNVPLSASDDDGADTLSFSEAGLPSFCSLTDNGDRSGDVDCTPGFDDAGSYSVTITVSDGTDSDSDSFNIDVDDVNQVPVLAAIGNQSVNEGDTLNVSLSATDDDSGDTLSFSENGLPNFCNLTDNGDRTGSLSCSPDFDDAGSYSVTVTVTDDGSGSASDAETFNIDVDDVNQAPVLEPIGDQSVDEGDTLDVRLSASDPDSGGTLTFSASGLPSFCGLTDDTGTRGNLRCTPGFGDAGTSTVTVTVFDEGTPVASASETFDIVVGDVNQPPVLAAIGNQSVDEGVTLNVPLSASDDDGGDTLSFSQIGLPSFCSLTDNNNRTGSLDCTPGFGDAGKYPVTVTVTDNGTGPASDSETFDINVGNVNQAPVLAPIGNQSVNEGVTLIVPLSATDADDDTLSFSENGLPNFCDLTDNGDRTGSLSCAPGFGDSGSYSVTVTVTDDGSGSASDAETFNIDVDDVNQAPVMAPIGNKTVDELVELTFTATATDADIPADTLTFSLGPGAPTGVSITAGGDFSWTPTEAQGPGSYPITVLVADSGSPALSDFETITVTVNEVNAAPTANDDSFDVLEGGSPVAGSNVLANDTDPDEVVPNLTARLLSGPALDPNFVLRADGTFSYTHDGSETRTDSFTYEACDSALSCSPSATATINVDNVNDPPVIEGQRPLSIEEDTPLLITLADITVTDVDSDPATFVLSVQAGDNYTLVDNTITPVADFNGDLTVPVTVSDDEDTSDVFNLTVTVTAVNDAPLITGQAALSMPEDSSLTILITDLTVFDPDPGSIFPDDFTLSLLDGSNYTRAGNTITPDPNLNGPLSVPATVSDGLLTSPQFILTVDVSPENDEPVVAAPIDNQIAIEGTAFSLSISGNFSDADGDPLQFAAIGLPVSGNLTLDPVTGVFSGTPRLDDARDNDPYLITVTATDGQPGSLPAQAEFALNISALDRANVSLDISVSPDPAMLNDELQWTFTANNAVGPQAATNVALTGSFVGSGLSIASDVNCTIQAAVGQVTDFSCTLGSLPVGASATVVLTTITSAPGDVVVFGTAATTDTLPLDPNLDDNSSQIAVGVAEAFSNGAVQALGRTDVRSIAAGDINGDGAVDLVAGTAAGQSIEIYLSGGFRDFVESPILLPDNSANEGVALADFDQNGTLDLVVANGGGQADVVYSNDGVGNFAPMAVLGLTFSEDVAVGDFDNDGVIDIVFATTLGNPVYLGTGAGDFVLHATLGNANSRAVAVAELNSDALDDIVFANAGSASQVWIKNSGVGFSPGAVLAIGDAASVTVGEFGGDLRPDLAFGRISSGIGDVPANPVLINDGGGGFAGPFVLLGTSPTTDIHAGDVNRDGLADLVFINSSGVHQIWTATGSGFDLHREQIVDADSVVGILTELGLTDVGDAGGVDLAMGGAVLSGLGVFLNDGFGNLGRGDAVPPVLTLLGEASVEVPSGSNYVDAGATAEDNIDGDISDSVVVTAAVNTAVVGSYIVTYDVVDFAGNDATPITRTVTVTPAAGAGGGGGGATGWLSLLLLILAACVAAYHSKYAIIAAKGQE